MSENTDAGRVSIPLQRELDVSYEEGMKLPLLSVIKLSYGDNPTPRYLTSLVGTMAHEITKIKPKNFQAFIKSKRAKPYRRLRKYALRTCWGGNV